jgi:hypothetical protein
MGFNAMLGCVVNVLGLIESNLGDQGSYLIVATDNDLFTIDKLSTVFVDDGSLGKLSYKSHVVMAINSGRDIYPSAWVPENDTTFQFKDGRPSVSVKAIIHDYDIKYFIVVRSSATIKKL